MKIHEGDEWKREAAPKPTSRTRAAQQSHIDVEYANGRMALCDWRLQTDEMSDPLKWDARGKVTV